jgi:hypothetical protein
MSAPVGVGLAFGRCRRRGAAASPPPVIGGGFGGGASEHSEGVWNAALDFIKTHPELAALLDDPMTGIRAQVALAVTTSS